VGIARISRIRFFLSLVEKKRGRNYTRSRVQRACVRVCVHIFSRTATRSRANILPLRCDHSGRKRDERRVSVTRGAERARFHKSSVRFLRGLQSREAIARYREKSVGRSRARAALSRLFIYPAVAIRRVKR